ncbi:hypothetical protein [Citrobacter freundii]|uniref:hypothetical protein n=1 Tax=Citrobacter freundii TaxID=546 RepID=UPI003D764F69
MSQNISQLRPSKPVDCTLPRHGMFRHTEDDKWQINLYMLFKKLPKPRGSRAIWYKTSQNMVQKLPADIFGREIREIGAVFHDEIDRNTWITASSALMNPLMILVKIIKLRWIHILSYDQMVSRKINNQTTRCANSIFYTTLFTNSAPNYT